jgi:hypothetical protein
MHRALQHEAMHKPAWLQGQERTTMVLMAGAWEEQPSAQQHGSYTNAIA